MLITLHRTTRRVALAWLLASAVFAAITLLRPEMWINDRAALSTLVPLYFLSLPLGHLGVIAMNRLKLMLILDFNLVPSVFAEGLALWVLLTVLGYLQWFVLLPWIARWCSHLSRILFKRGPAR